MLIKNLFIVLLLIFFGSSCTVTKEKKVEIGSKNLQPKRKPVYNQTNMESALRCVDQHLKNRSDISKIRIYVDSNFPDLGAAGVRSTRDMIITALLKLSAKSRKIGAIIYQQGSDLGYMSDASPGGARFKFPQYFLRGSITQAEKNHTTGGTTKSASFGIPKILNAGVKDSVKDKVSSVGLDLHLGEIDTLELISGMYSSNMLSIVQQDEAGDAYVGVMDKADFEYEVEFSEREGMSSAVRTLTELGVLEIVGKLFNLDYQSCVNPRGAKKTYTQPVITPSKAVKKPAKVMKDTGNFTMEMTSNKGVSPVYGIGEKIRMTVFPEQDMNLYCFYEDNNKKSITQLFPNSYTSSAYKKKNQPLELPSNDMPFSIEMDKSSVDKITCFGTKSDITNSLGYTPLEGISNTTIDKVESKIKKLSNDSIIKESLTITIQ